MKDGGRKDERKRGGRMKGRGRNWMKVRGRIKGRRRKKAW